MSTVPPHPLISPICVPIFPSPTPLSLHLSKNPLFSIHYSSLYLFLDTVFGRPGFFLGELGLSLGKRKEADEIARLDEAMKQVIAKTEEYKKELLAKKKQLEELNAGLGPGVE